MKPHSRKIIHVGINFLTIPAPLLNNQSSLMFQQAILSQGLEYIRAESLKNQITLTREEPSPLQISVGSPEPQFGQVLIVAPNPNCAFDLFVQEAEAAITAYESVWLSTNRQILKCDTTIRDLYETTSQHAFQELWERRLNQPSKSLSAFGRPIRGGGLRFVMDPLPNEQDPVQIEVKIESFLADTSKVFIETQFVWMKPNNPGMPFNARERLLQVNTFIENQVNAFIAGESIGVSQ